MSRWLCGPSCRWTIRRPTHMTKCPHCCGWTGDIRAEVLHARRAGAR